MSIFQNSRPGSFSHVAAALALLAAAPIAAQAMSAHRGALPKARPVAMFACEAGELARMGQLTRLGAGAFVSKRGEVVSLGSCPALKDRLIVANS